MNTVTECVICEGAIVRLRKGITAPFLARRIWQRLPFAVDLAQCCRCGFIFFNPRLEQHEEERLYAGYRGGDYQATRYSCEPWYTRKFNGRLTDPKYCAVRRTALAPVLARYLAK